MKDSNFDSIKEKFDNCGVNAPDALNEEAVTAMLPQQPLQEVPPPKSKRKLALGITAAAACAVVTAGAITFTSLFRQVPQPVQQPPKVASLRSFGSREEVKQALNKTLTIRNGANGTDVAYTMPGIVYEKGYDSDAAAGSSSGSANGSANGNADENIAASPQHDSAASSHNSTYIQSVGVDEADTVKTTDQYIFYRCGQTTIAVFSAEGSRSRQVAALVPFDRDGWLSDFYVVGDRLVVLGEIWRNDADIPLFDDLLNSYRGNGEFVTEAAVFDISDVHAIRRLDSFVQSGSYVNSRMIGDTLYLITNEQVLDENEWPRVGGAAASPDSATVDSATVDSATPDSVTMREVPVDDIYSVENPVDNSFLVVSRVDTQNGARATATKAILGTADTIYCNQDNLYITANAYSQPVYDIMLRYYEAAASNVTLPYDYEAQRLLDQAEWRGPEQTQIYKVSLQNDIEFVASGKVNGAIRNQYSLDEYNGYLRVATTSYDIDSSLNRETNNLFVLDSDLKQAGAVTDFAYGESIKAVRYIDETAYVITYEQTDPLFVIDVSVPSNPVMLGEVKISGFSTLLVPVDHNTLLGIGYHTVDEANDNTDMEIQEGLKIVTFDVTDKTDPKVIDTKIYEYCDSAVQHDPHALLVNFERGDYSIPLHRYDYRSGAAETYGLINFRVDNGKINIIDEYTSPKFVGGAVASRCVYVGSDQYLIGSEWSYRGGDSDPYSAVIDSVPYH